MGCRVPRVRCGHFPGSSPCRPHTQLQSAKRAALGEEGDSRQRASHLHCSLQKSTPLPPRPPTFSWPSASSWGLTCTRMKSLGHLQHRRLAPWSSRRCPAPPRAARVVRPLGRLHRSSAAPHGTAVPRVAPKLAPLRRCSGRHAGYESHRPIHPHCLTGRQAPYWQRKRFPRCPAPDTRCPQWPDKRDHRYSAAHGGNATSWVLASIRGIPNPNLWRAEPGSLPISPACAAAPAAQPPGDADLLPDEAVLPVPARCRAHLSRSPPPGKP